ncbi:MAG: hypothetical protein AB7P20_20080 [Rhizobiaceae bacterium]
MASQQFAAIEDADTGKLLILERLVQGVDQDRDAALRILGQRLSEFLLRHRRIG